MRLKMLTTKNPSRARSLCLLERMLPVSGRRVGKPTHPHLWDIETRRGVSMAATDKQHTCKQSLM